MLRLLFTVLLVAAASTSHAAPTAVTEFDEIYSQSLDQAAGTFNAQVFFRLAQIRSQSGNSNFKNMGQLANYLADDFSLYTRVQSEIIQTHCSEEGKDITPYLAALASEGKPDATVADNIYARLGISYENVWQQMRPQALSGKAGLVNNSADILGLPISELCIQLVSDPNGSAQRLAYSSVRISRSQALRAISP